MALWRRSEEGTESEAARGSTRRDASVGAAVEEGLQRAKQFQRELDPEVVLIVVVYFLQGALALSRLATNFYLKDELHLSPAELAALAGVFSAPWVVKP